MLRYAFKRDAPGVDEDGQAAKGHAGSHQDLRPLRTAEMLPSLRIRDLRATTKGPAPAGFRYNHVTGPLPSARPRDPRATTVGRDGRSSPRAGAGRRGAHGAHARHG